MALQAGVIAKTKRPRTEVSDPKAARTLKKAKTPIDPEKAQIPDSEVEKLFAKNQRLRSGKSKRFAKNQKTPNGNFRSEIRSGSSDRFEKKTKTSDPERATKFLQKKQKPRSARAKILIRAPKSPVKRSSHCIPKQTFV